MRTFVLAFARSLLPKVFGAPHIREMTAGAVLTHMAADEAREAGNTKIVDIVEWARRNFYIPATERQIQLMPHQVAILRYAFTRGASGHFPYQTIIYSTVKQSGKSTISGVIARWMAETQVRYGDIFFCGNDADQAKGRGFREAAVSIELTPGYLKGRDVLPGRWRLQKTQMECLTTGATVKAVAVDARGEAGGKPALSVWTELWGFDKPEAVHFWEELSPVPTIPDSLRLVETYAGATGDSVLLEDLFDRAKNGRQLTAGELAAVAARDAPGESLEEFLEAFAETGGNPNALIPIWVDEASSIFMYWDEGTVARRMPWQQGERGEIYYRAEEASLPEAAFRRHHNNEWVGAESEFVPIEAWDACYDPTLASLPPGDKTPIVIGVDAATTGDCFGITAVCRNPLRHDDVAVLEERVWTPPPGGAIDYGEPEAFLRWLIANYNIVQIAYDPYQLEDMMQRFTKERLVWCEAFPQQQERLKADRQLYDLIMNRRITHRGQPGLREHILNARKRVQRDEDSKLRIVKKTAGRKIDLAVSLSMASARCLYLLI